MALFASKPPLTGQLTPQEIVAAPPPPKGGKPAPVDVITFSMPEFKAQCGPLLISVASVKGAVVFTVKTTRGKLVAQTIVPQP
jgi:hypothetical protein